MWCVPNTWLCYAVDPVLAPVFAPVAAICASLVRVGALWIRIEQTRHITLRRTRYEGAGEA